MEKEKKTKARREIGFRSSIQVRVFTNVCWLQRSGWKNSWLVSINKY